MSSKSAAAKLNRAIFAKILNLIRDSSPVPEEDTRKVYYLKRLGYLHQLEETYFISPKGLQLLSEEAIWSLTIKKTPTWNGKWHLVLFDIPKDKRKRRDAFRLRLKELGLVLYQNSVWIYPYPLEYTVQNIATFYKLTGCVSFIVAENLTGEKTFLNHFKLKRN